MKALLGLSLIVVSSVASACPELSGMYWRCKSTSSMDMFKVQSAYIFQDESNVMTFGRMVLDETEVATYTPDGVVRSETIEVDGQTVTVDVSAHCDESSFVVESKLSGTDMTEELRLAKNSEGGLVIKNIVDGELYNVTTCRPMNE